MTYISNLSINYNDSVNIESDHLNIPNDNAFFFMQMKYNFSNSKWSNK